MSVISISILFIAIGIASDNLLFAALYGKNFQLTKNINLKSSLGNFLFCYYYCFGIHAYSVNDKGGKKTVFTNGFNTGFCSNRFYAGSINFYSGAYFICFSKEVIELWGQ